MLVYSLIHNHTRDISTNNEFLSSNSGSLSLDQGLAIQSASAPPCHMVRGGRRHNSRNTGSRATTSPSRHALSVADNPQAIPGHSQREAAILECLRQPKFVKWMAVVNLNQKMKFLRELIPRVAPAAPSPARRTATQQSTSILLKDCGL